MTLNVLLFLSVLVLLYTTLCKVLSHGFLRIDNSKFRKIDPEPLGNAATGDAQSLAIQNINIEMLAQKYTRLAQLPTAVILRVTTGIPIAALINMTQMTFGNARTSPVLALSEDAIESLGGDEVVEAILAHEIAHGYKPKRLSIFVRLGLLVAELSLQRLWLFLTLVGALFFAIMAFEGTQTSANIALLGALLPLTLLSLFEMAGNVLDRREEYRADAYAALWNKRNAERLIGFFKRDLAHLEGRMKTIVFYFALPFMTHPHPSQRTKRLKRFLEREGNVAPA
ncbi:MAG: M48 family metalloprotease [Parcubacteria group bacterium]|nr:M48 family metalloprotease [Parcubacteria group bacterium]